MSYGTGRERKQRLKKLSQITDQNVGDFLRLAGEQYASDFVNTVNDRASDRETSLDAKFLKAVADKSVENATVAFKDDFDKIKLSEILQDIIKRQTGINFDADVTEVVKRYLDTPAARGEFFKAAEKGIRRVVQLPIQLGLSRTVLQKYWNGDQA